MLVIIMIRGAERIEANSNLYRHAIRNGDTPKTLLKVMPGSRASPVAVMLSMIVDHQRDRSHLINAFFDSDIPTTRESRPIDSEYV